MNWFLLQGVRGEGNITEVCRRGCIAGDNGVGEVQGYSHSHSDRTLQDAIVYCLRRMRDEKTKTIPKQNS